LIAVFIMSATAAVQGLKLFGTQGSRTPLVSWYLNEIKVPYTMVNPREDRNPNPFGGVPCLVDNELCLFESGAILLYLADKYGDCDTPERRARVGVWCVWANATLDPILFKENERGQVVGTGASEENRKLRMLDAQLEGKEYLLGEFSVADVAVASYLLYIPQFFGAKVNFGRYKNLSAYMKRCAGRTAYRAAYPSETDQILVVCDTFK
jgi:glutathione S-transferase